MPTCRSCGHENPEAQKFCGECGASLQATTALAEERKVVTIVFCDLVMFTARSETLDPEDVRAFLVPYYDVLTDEITRHGGVVDKFLGDGVMAVFGAPLAHEDDPERAVRTALKILERIPALGLDLHARVGITTGEVMVVPDPAGRGDAITGDAANTASRLQALAPVDGVVVGEATYRATSHLFDYEVLEPAQVKGKAEPVKIYRPSRALGRVGRAIEESTPFVGRDLELESLIRLFDRSRTGPSTEFVTIVADPGIGKSRLVRELARHVEELPELITWRVGHCLPYGDGISFWALGEIIKAHAGIFDTDDQATLSAKLDRVLVEPDESLRLWMRQRIAPLVGLETTAEPPQQEEAFTAWRRFLEQMASDRCLVVVIEDLHWADDAMVRFLEHVCAHTEGVQLLVITTARSEIAERHPGWLGDPGRAELPLATLADEDIHTLVESVLEGASEALVATVLERAGGSPLYAEQLAAMLREQAMPIAGGSIDESAIPPTIQALLAARIDALPPELKAVLLDASVVGRAFWFGVVGALGNHPELETDLVELVRRDFIRAAHPSSMGGELEFLFVHALVRDVAYAELPRVVRSKAHASTARWLERKAPDKVDEIANHYYAALELAKAANDRTSESRLTKPTMTYLLRAGERGFDLDHTRAEEQLRRAQSLAEPSSEFLPRILELRGDLARDGSRQSEAIDLYERALALHRQRQDLDSAASLMMSLSHVLYRRGDSRFRAFDDEALDILEGGPPTSELLRALVNKASSDNLVGLHREALALSGRAIDLALQHGLEVPAGALEIHGSARVELGDASGLVEMREALDAAITRGEGWRGAAEYCNVGDSVLLFHGPAAGIELFRRGIEWSESRGIQDGMLFNAGELAMALFESGDLDGALSAALRTERGVADLGEDAIDTLLLARSVVVLVGCDQGDPPRRDHAAWLEESFWGTEQIEWIVRALASATVGYMALDELDAAKRALELSAPLRKSNLAWARTMSQMVRAAMALGEPELATRLLSDFEPVTPFGLHAAAGGRAAVAEASHDWVTARDAYSDSAQGWAELGALPERAHALAGLGRCLLALGEAQEGVAKLNESRELWFDMKALPRIAEIDELLSTAG